MKRASTAHATAVASQPALPMPPANSSPEAMALREAANAFGGEPTDPSDAAQLDRVLLLRALSYAAVVASTWQLPLRPKHLAILERLRDVGAQGAPAKSVMRMAGWKDLAQWSLVDGADERVARLTADGAAVLALFQATRRSV